MGVTKQAAQKRFAAGDEPLLPGFDALGVGTPTPGTDPDPTELRRLQYTTGCREAFKNALKAAEAVLQQRRQAG